MYLRKDRTIYLIAGITDMRKQINGLAAIAQAKRPGTVFSGSYFVFLGKTRKVMKILYWDKSGFCLWVKRLEEETFPLQRDPNPVERFFQNCKLSHRPRVYNYNSREIRMQYPLII